MRLERSIALVVLAILLLPQVSLADCFKSEECDGDAICINQECVSSDDALKNCEGDTCSEGVCDDGFCKPDTIICENDWGRCEFGQNGGDCSCADGSGIGMGWDSAGGIDGEEPDMLTDEELYEICISSLNDCDPPPDLDEVCANDEDEQLCTGYAAKLELLEANCEDYFEDDYEGTSDTETTVSDNKTDTDVEMSSDVDGGVDSDVDIDPDEETTTNTGEDEDSLTAPNAPSLIDTWMIGDCCEELSDPDTEYSTEIRALYICLAALSDNDCEGAVACEAAFEDSGAGPKDGDSVNNRDDEWDTESQTPTLSDDADAGIGISLDGDAESIDQNAGDEKEEASDEEDGANSEDKESDSDQADKESDDNTESDTDEDTNTDDDETGATKADGETADSSSSGGCSFVPDSSENPFISLVEVLF